ncbi:HAMP domain-containing protein [Rhizobium sp. P32RR-XVIII]|uniref:methyl-accepting chemotaxis protein n=1 Tax=Rhizobium sp. P32RR-XVIII TaxID=2726738 RepID=UPI0014576347|nr:methyl-accepting chemotaxis protein [Rhizobium sp. P32RR-XVIII]NLS04702.1 HAMP domain-containing protein [Rhizobium sp. P32RR-XVIII]
MKRPNIKTAMTGIFAVFAVLFAITAVVSLSGLSTLNENTQDQVTSIQPSISRAKDIQIARYSLRGSYGDYAMGRSSGDPALYPDKIAKKEVELKDAIKDYKGLVNNDAERAAFDEVEASANQYTQTGQAMVALIKAGKAKEGLASFDNDLGPIADALSASVDKLVKLNQQQSDEGIVTARDQYVRTMTMIYTVLAIGALMVCGGTYFGIAGIATPITRITMAMRNLADGDTAAEIASKDRTDEIGEMANAVEIFRQAAIANKQLQAEAEVNRNKADAERNRLMSEAEEAAQVKLQTATAGLAAGLRRLASGDLAFQLSEPFAPDFESLRHDLNTAASQLGDALSAVSNSANAIDAGTQEISRGADDLSKRTEQQAASLEETAAALDEITVNVSNSSKRTDEARQVAVQANDSAAQSGKVVANAVEAMEKIEDSSNQISSIIGVIDEIAFQTNLLALNAGVEAARAGEAGKGFAVVAQEVRELAQRSAQAAKQIKDLIRNSSAEVEVGVRLVRETGEALQNIEGLIVTINHHMNAIATSSKEQSTGLSEVNAAVNQMDQVTQQNAAMVEETNAASATLAAEAARMRELIGGFQLSGGMAAGSQVSRLRQASAAMAKPQARYAAPVTHGNAAVKQEWSEF